VDCSGASVELVRCTIRDNESDGVYASGSTVTVLLRGGSVAGNKHDGVFAEDGATVTVAKAETDIPQPVCTDNENHNWHTLDNERGNQGDNAAIINIPEGKISHEEDYE